MLTFGGRGDVDAALTLLDFIPRDSISSPFQSPQKLLLNQVIISRQVSDVILSLAHFPVNLRHDAYVNKC